MEEPYARGILFSRSTSDEPYRSDDRRILILTVQSCKWCVGVEDDFFFLSQLISCTLCSVSLSLQSGVLSQTTTLDEWLPEPDVLAAHRRRFAIPFYQGVNEILSMDVVEGSSASLSCVFNTVVQTISAITWQYSPAVLGERAMVHELCLFDPCPTYSIQNLTTDHSGQYSCIVGFVGGSGVDAIFIFNLNVFSKFQKLNVLLKGNSSQKSLFAN